MRALILVDMQYDFLPGGALAVPDGDAVIGVANALQDAFELVVASQDWHPPNHSSFASQHPGKKPGDVVELDGLTQILWPDHCVENTHGAEFSRRLRRDKIRAVFHKGTDPKIDSYSSFFDNAHRRATGLGDYLFQNHVRQVVLTGLATDYCVKFTALDAIDLSFETSVVVDGCRGIDINPGDVDRALEEMRKAGVALVQSNAL